ncbi:butyrophilin subfamily 2 member A1-like [Cottoperca gobio]|uniref:Butyrophilin subfamily 2 member A1-like n=1 Tax=Cottoperca gobio TaxID=56716 RepID=A0A6J2RM45_COTGO|nr:butyrophilin subfamily 2 member A1-like [Cottoperca gobio]
MLPQKNRLSLQASLSVLVFHLLLTHSCRGQSQLIGPPQPIVAAVGDDIILPCHLEPAEDVVAMTLEWTRSDLDSEFVFVWRSGQDLVHAKHPSFKGRTSLFSEELKHGNISLKLSKVQLSDRGTYSCFIPKLDKRSVVELVVGAVSSAVISLAGTDRDRGGVMLDCESAGWYPEPEVLWLDAEGKLLSAGPPETVRGPDDLYTVSSRVTVEKRHSNSFTCRVQQKNTNLSRDAHIHVPEGFFPVQSSSSPLFIVLAVTVAACIFIILLLVLWKLRGNINKTKRNPSEETEEGRETGEMLVTGQEQRREEELQKEQQMRREEERRREEAEKKLETHQEEADTKNKEQEPEDDEFSTSSARQNSNSGLVFEFDPQCRSFSLRNTSHEDKELNDWELQVQINDRKPITHRFHHLFRFKAGRRHTIWEPRHGSSSPNNQPYNLPSNQPYNQPYNQLWKELKFWRRGDKLQVSLCSPTGQIQHLSVHVSDGQ